MKPRELITPAHVFELTGIPESTLAQWRYLGKELRFYKLGRHVRYDKAEVLAWIDASVQEVAA